MHGLPEFGDKRWTAWIASTLGTTFSKPPEPRTAAKGLNALTQARRTAPARANGGLSVNDVGGEILVYDRDTDTAHCLSETAALVWRACDGKLTIQELADREALDPDTVRRALAS